MIEPFAGYVVDYRHFGEYAALIAILTEQGIVYCYDKKFFFDYETEVSYLKSTKYIISLAQGADEHRFYLKKLESIKRFEWSDEYIPYIQFMMHLVLRTYKSIESPKLFFKFYERLCLRIEQKPSDEEMYFYLSYIEIHLLGLMGLGKFVDHVDEILRLKTISGNFGNNFLLKKMIQEDFLVVQAYVARFIQQSFSLNQSFILLMQSLCLI